MSYFLLKFAIFLFLIWTRCLPLNFALDQNAVPKSYSIRIIPDVEYDGNFTGEVWIDVFVKYSTDKILLHSKGLEIRTVSVRNNFSSEFRTYFGVDEENELLRVTTDPYLVYDGSYKVHIRYDGVLNENMIGFYRSWYKVNKEIK